MIKKSIGLYLILAFMLNIANAKTDNYQKNNTVKKIDAEKAKLFVTTYCFELVHEIKQNEDLRKEIINRGYKDSKYKDIREEILNLSTIYKNLCSY